MQLPPPPTFPWVIFGPLCAVAVCISLTISGKLGGLLALINLLATWTREGPSAKQSPAPARKVRKRRKAQVQSPLADDGSAE